jgi:hypothetical protein
MNTEQLCMHARKSMRYERWLIKASELITKKTHVGSSRCPAKWKIQPSIQMFLTAACQ